MLTQHFLLAEVCDSLAKLVSYDLRFLLSNGVFHVLVQHVGFGLLVRRNLQRLVWLIDIDRLNLLGQVHPSGHFARRIHFVDVRLFHWSWEVNVPLKSIDRWRVKLLVKFRQLLGFGGFHCLFRVVLLCNQLS